jgi:hypothetical protein
MEVELIEWEDAWYKEGRATIAEMVKRAQSFPTVCVGYVVHENKQVVMLSAYLYKAEVEDGEIDMVMCIPKKMITRRTVLQEPPEPSSP